MERTNVSCPNCGSKELIDLGFEHDMEWTYVKIVSTDKNGDREGTEYKNKTGNVKFRCRKCNWPVPAFNPSKRIVSV